ncbi:hypothetical protein BLNAU_6130 [Blattamonas nauphoetae]|uniref:Uncharacterized protein n=1 Tax=Blattamonas nauphoetae TaxID=2049346 RepID=A0ABQ9Y561_9EUKA|nr:hypothetical protein BLNAU_6130 [Blattamonas nauphoetae]
MLIGVSSQQHDFSSSRREIQQLGSPSQAHLADMIVMVMTLVIDPVGCTFSPASYQYTQYETELELAHLKQFYKTRTLRNSKDDCFVSSTTDAMANAHNCYGFYEHKWKDSTQPICDPVERHRQLTSRKPFFESSVRLCARLTPEMIVVKLSLGNQGVRYPHVSIGNTTPTAVISSNPTSRREFNSVHDIHPLQTVLHLNNLSLDRQDRSQHTYNRTADLYEDEDDEGPICGSSFSSVLCERVTLDGGMHDIPLSNHLYVIISDDTATTEHIQSSNIVRSLVGELLYVKEYCGGLSPTRGLLC